MGEYGAKLESGKFCPTLMRETTSKGQFTSVEWASLLITTQVAFF